MEVVTDFLKNCGLLDLLVIVVTLILILARILILIFRRSRRVTYAFLVTASLPLLLGFFAMYMKNQVTARGFDMFGRIRPEAIALYRRDALIIACVGAGGTVLVVLIGLFDLALKKNGKVRLG